MEWWNGGMLLGFKCLAVDMILCDEVMWVMVVEE